MVGHGPSLDFEDSALLISGLVLGPATAVYVFAAWSGWWGTAAAVAMCGAIVTVGAAAWWRGMALEVRAARAKDLSLIHISEPTRRS
ncbi:hypothetical protein [Streptomyces sp. MZ04]|uniref:hypothetical protein n=1 Tax=Streptomyces sp. MZ04 TaxID=2559236 RepID=UPI00107E7EAE|nr:hypothetical protein [Streptomyces sp. MZ04]TGA92571.1 hypothetical protein E2651_36735 [Streptomyces sp. MZ04]